MIRPPRRNEKLTNIINKIGRKKLVSLELNPYIPIDYRNVCELNPSFCSVVWLARRNETENLKLLPPIVITKKLIELGYTILIHLPGIFYTEKKMHDILSLLKIYGVRNIFAMRGGDPHLKIENCDFPFALDIIKFIRKDFGDYFDIATTGFPHIHPSSTSAEDDMCNLKKKILFGATLVITQACVNSTVYLDFSKNCIKYAIDVPIIYGLSMFRSCKDFMRIFKMSLFVDEEEMLTIQRCIKGPKRKIFLRNKSKYLVQQLLNDDLTVGVHLFSRNHFDLIKNVLTEINVMKYKAVLMK
ncbi:hypothetical protein WA026_011362 [Henosepilachna vigintioctopunctata]|uniref:Methylenetetrahydrofolate reductase (NAD(P)H) n=1 Tax=Henosepilachna vigintioctopunctata TaxID=420089 RepID=A0AAW1TTL7_9CUCU